MSTAVAAFAALILWQGRMLRIKLCWSFLLVKDLQLMRCVVRRNPYNINLSPDLTPKAADSTT
jgi:hypothetical protein